MRPLFWICGLDAWLLVHIAAHNYEPEMLADSIVEIFLQSTTQHDEMGAGKDNSLPSTVGGKKER